MVDSWLSMVNSPISIADSWLIKPFGWTAVAVYHSPTVASESRWLVRIKNNQAMWSSLEVGGLTRPLNLPLGSSHQKGCSEDHLGVLGI